MGKMGRHQILLRIVILPLLLVSCSDKWHQVSSPVSAGITFHTHRQTEFDDCFLENAGRLIDGISGLFTASCTAEMVRVPIEVRLVDNSFAGGYYQPRIGHSVIGIVVTERQHAVFAHEYVRHLCYVTGCCEWWNSSYNWTGFIGDQWQNAETLAYKACG